MLWSRTVFNFLFNFKSVAGLCCECLKDVSEMFFCFSIRTRHYLDVDSTFSERYGRRMNALCLLCNIFMCFFLVSITSKSVKVVQVQYVKLYQSFI